MKAVILAGGGGIRMWPLSRATKPKQFLPIMNGETLFSLTRTRLLGMFQEEDIYYSVNPLTAGLVREAYPKIRDDQFIIEPEKRDTGPAMGFAAAILAIRFPDEPIVFVPSDHYIGDSEKFQTSLQVADDLILQTGKLLDIGVTPTWPNTNLGYTHVGKRIEERSGVSIFEFLGHTEKPPRDEAERFLADGGYLWHANYYMWTPKKFLEAYARHAPTMHEGLTRIQEHYRRGDVDAIAAVYGDLEMRSFDYAITEKLDPSDVFIIRAPFDWSDVGLWGALKQLREENRDDNVVEGADHASIDSSNCLIYGSKKKVIATIGIEDLIVVDTDDALLICKNDRDQDIKRIVDDLRQTGREKYL